MILRASSRRNNYPDCKPSSITLFLITLIRQIDREISEMNERNAKSLRERSSMKKEPHESTRGLIAVCYLAHLSTCSHVCLTFLPRVSTSSLASLANCRRDSAIRNLVQLLRMLYPLNAHRDDTAGNR